MVRGAALVAVAWLALVCSVPGQAAAPLPDARAQPDFTQLVKTYGSTVVNIGVARDAVVRRPGLPLAQDRLDDNSLGSGFIVGADGYILTNAHVVAGSRAISVKLSDRREFTARLLGIDSLTDVALLKIEASGLPVVQAGDPAQVEVGEWVLAIGAPYGFSNSVTAGIVSAKGRTLPGGGYTPFLQTDVPINPGNSGGPLFNMRGEVIGINSRIYSNNGGYQGLSFAIPIDVAMRVKAQLQAHGVVTRARLGVAVQDVSQALARSFGLARPAGALVNYVAPDSTAARAGLRSGDVILKVDQIEVQQATDALGYIAASTPGQQVTLQVWRDQALLPLSIATEAVPVVAAAPVVPALVALDVTVRPLSAVEQTALRLGGGLLVQNANPAAIRSGVKVGDIILAVNGQNIEGIDDLQVKIRQAQGRAALLIQRGRTRLFVPLGSGNGTTGEGQESTNR